VKRDYPNRPFVAVGVVIWQGDRVLLTRRAKPPRAGAWSIPGGAQHIGETIFETAHREVMEETGLLIKNLQLIDVIDLIDRDEENQIRHHYTLIDLQAEYSSGSIKPGDDCTDARWVRPDEMENYDLWHETTSMIRLAATKRPMSKCKSG
tara:strand:- start:850 stop:1299 length:450 start_codon:yes stop_codon:yes gene_type:complete